MADELIISVSTDVWSKRVLEYMAATGKNLQAALTEEWPRLIRVIINFTPPFATGNNIDTAQISGRSDYSVGRKAVARDVYRTMRPFDPSQIRSAALQKVVDEKNFAALEIIARRSSNPYMQGLRAVHFDPYFHTSQRDARGRVPKSVAARNTVVLGADAALLKKYVVAVQNRVGFAKGGWARAYWLVAAPAEAGPLPDWVGRFGGAGGSVFDDRANTDSPSITAINRTPWAVRKDEWARIRASAFAQRGAAIRSKIITYMKLARKQSGFHGPSDVAA